MGQTSSLSCLILLSISNLLPIGQHLKAHYLEQNGFINVIRKGISIVNLDLVNPRQIHLANSQDYVVAFPKTAILDGCSWLHPQGN